jgi:eukaryotic-like serine/threonine-protein kinase
VGVPSRLASPRALARLIAGDLDAILLKALRRDPAERYVSVEKFDDDVRAFLERRPVKARSGTWRYLAARFVARNKLPLAAAALVLSTLVAGLGLVERERRLAVAEKARAERHFASVRQLANAFVFDVDAEIAHLAGALKARQTLVATAARYLDSLAQESEGDPALALELASTYRRLAEISGDARVAHLGDPGLARRHVTRADTLLRAVEARDPTNAPALREHRIVALLLGRLRLEGGDSGGVEDTARGGALAERLAALPGATPADRRDLGATLAEWGGILAVVRDDRAGAAALLGRAVELLEAQVAADRSDVATRAVLGYAYERAAMAAEVTGDEGLPRALALMRKSIEVSEAVVRDEPQRVLHRHKLATRYNSAVRVQLRLRDLPGARADATAAREATNRLLADDPGNVANLTGQASVLASASQVEHLAGQHAAAITLAREAIAANELIPAETRRGLVVRDTLATAQVAFAASACALGTPPALVQEGLRLFAEAAAFKRELITRGIDASEATAELRRIESGVARCRAVAAKAP